MNEVFVRICEFYRLALNAYRKGEYSDVHDEAHLGVSPFLRWTIAERQIVLWVAYLKLGFIV